MRVPAPQSHRLADESGFGIIEVLVSAVILVIAALGMFAAFDSANATSSRNAQRTQAAQIAQAEQERVRAKTPSQLAALTNQPLGESTSKVVKGRTYTTVSSASWTTDSSGPASCSGMGSEAGFLRITSTVKWTNQGTVPDVVQDSIKAVPNGGYRDARGSVAVRVYNRANAGQPNITVTIVGPGGKNYGPLTTNANGCVLLGFVPVGSYTVTLNQTGYVRDELPGAQLVSETLQVQGEQTATAPFNYDVTGTLGVRYFTRLPGATTDIATTGDALTVAHSGLVNTPKARYFPASAPFATSAATQTTGKVLYPFTGAYAVWAGRCAANDPFLAGVAGSTGTGTGPTAPGTSGNGAGIVPANGTVSNVQAFEPMLKLTVTKYTGQAAAETPRVTVTPALAGCTKSYGPVNTTTSGTIADASQPTLPYGSYTICVQDRPTTPTRTVVQAVDNNTRAGRAITLALPAAATTKKTCP